MNLEPPSAQRSFLALHALAAGSEVGAEITELAQTSVTVEQILSLYPFSPGWLAQQLRTLLYSTLRLNSFVELNTNY